MATKPKPVIQGDLFASFLPAVSVKDDIHSMEYPLFSLSKNADIEIREYIDSRSGKSLKIVPSAYGMPTILDKDVLIYAISQLVAATNKGMPINRTIQFHTVDFLNTVKENQDGGKNYTLIVDSLRRLRGTTLETNIETGGVRETEGFGYIDDYKIVQKTTKGKGALTVQVSLSKWLFRALTEYEVLTLNKAYFSLAPIERRLYELSRKHVGAGVFWEIGMARLLEKSGSRQGLNEFAKAVRAAVKSDPLPDYRIYLDKSKKPLTVVFLSRDRKRLTEWLETNNKFDWYEKLTKDNPRG